MMCCDCHHAQTNPLSPVLQLCTLVRWHYWPFLPAGYSTKADLITLLQALAVTRDLDHPNVLPIMGVVVGTPDCLPLVLRAYLPLDVKAYLRDMRKSVARGDVMPQVRSGENSQLYQRIHNLIPACQVKVWNVQLPLIHVCMVFASTLA